MMAERYGKYTPLVDIETFVALFRKLQEEKRDLNKQENIPSIIKEQVKKALDQVKDSPGLNRNEDQIDVSTAISLNIS